MCITEDSDTAIGFSAYATAIRDYGANDIILFDQVVSNFGEHFQAANSVFLCPVDGVYIFSVNVQSTNSYSIAGAIMKETEVLLGFFSGSNDGSNDTGSTLGVTDCKKGEKIWVKSYGGGYQMNGSSKRYSSFSGFLLHRA